MSARKFRVDSEMGPKPKKIQMLISTQFDRRSQVVTTGLYNINKLESRVHTLTSLKGGSNTTTDASLKIN